MSGRTGSLSAGADWRLRASGFRGRRNSTAGLRRLAAALLMSLALCACAGTGAGQRRLYDELGQQAGIEALVEGLLFRTVDDERIAHHFADADIVRLRDKLVEQICVEAEGPCTYTGDDMRTSHAGRGISEADFDALVENLRDVMHDQRVPVRARNRLLKRLAAMHGDVVER